MKRFDTTLKMYADAGLRTIEDWDGFGRELREGAKPRTDTLHQGANVYFYSRDQTQQRMRKGKLSPVVQIVIDAKAVSQPM